ncbi:MAG: flavin reductase family protein [Armatimonadetes bacterium]|nr:flavin reductase family protein [Armatimonadota bacterium]
MPRQETHFTDHYAEVCKALGDWGALLLSLDANGKPNPMTIGWGSLGIVWSRPMWVVLVRPSRYTYGCLEETGDFTVNVPPAALDDVAMFCGTVSGRDHDKIAEKGLTVLPSETIRSPGIVECPIIYECKVVQKTDVVPEAFDPRITQQCYPQGDFHRVYFGEVLRTTADPAGVPTLLR